MFLYLVERCIRFYRSLQQAHIVKVCQVTVTVFYHCIEDQLLFCAEINAPYIDSGATELHLLRPYRAYSEHGVKMQVNLETLTIVNQVIFLISSSSPPSSPSCSVCSLQYSSLKK